MRIAVDAGIVPSSMVGCLPSESDAVSGMIWRTIRVSLDAVGRFYSGHL